MAFSKSSQVHESTRDSSLKTDHDSPSVRGQSSFDDLGPHGSASAAARPTTMQRVKKFLNKKDNYALKQPDGGITAWLQVLGCFLVFMNNWGLACSFGVYQAYYQLPDSKPSLAGRSPSQISWIGTIQASFTLIIGVASGPLFDKGYFFHVLVIASLLMFLAFMLLSLSTQYYQILLTQGVLQGLCSGLLYIPSIAQIPQYFTTKRGTALGIVTAGGPFGGIIYPILFRELINRYDFVIATRVLGGVVLGILVVTWILIKPLDLANKVVKKLRDPTMFKDPYYLSFCAASFFLFCGMLTPYIESATYSFEVVDGLQRDALVQLAQARPTLLTGILRRVSDAKDTAFYTVAIINAGNFAGRVIPAALSDRGLGPEYLMFGCCLALTALGFAWIAITDRAGYDVFMVLYGFASGGVAALPGVLLGWLTPSLDVLATRMGFVYMCAGLGVLIGTPIATAADAKAPVDKPYLGSQLWVGCTMAASLPFVIHSLYGCLVQRHIKQKAMREAAAGRVEVELGPKTPHKA